MEETPVMKSEKWNEGGVKYKHTLKKLDEHAKKYLDGRTGERPI